MKPRGHHTNAWAERIQEGLNVVREEDAAKPAPETANPESLGPDIAAGRLGDKDEHRIDRE